MAEILVEPDNRDPKNNSSIWPWILGLLLLAGVIWAAVELLDNDEREPELAAVETPVLEEEPVANRDAASINELAPVNEFVTYVQNDAVSPEMGIDHKYTSEALQKLQAALVAIGNDQVDLNADIEQKTQMLERAANKITTDPQSLQHANTIQEAFVAAANLMDAMQENFYPDLNDEVQEVQEIANSFNASEPTLEQKDKVHQFFQASAEAVKAMNETVVTE